MESGPWETAGHLIRSEMFPLSSESEGTELSARSFLPQSPASRLFSSLRIIAGKWRQLLKVTGLLYLTFKCVTRSEHIKVGQ